MASPLDTAVLALSPSFYWGMEDAVGSSTCADLSGNGNTLTNTSMTLGEPSIVPSDALTCAYLSGAATQGVARSTYKPAIASNVAVSVMAVAQFSTVPINVTMLLNNLSSSKGQQLKVTTASQLAWDLGNGTTSVNKSSGATLTAGHSYLVVGTYSYASTTMTVYVYDLTTVTTYTPVTATLGAGSFSPTVSWQIEEVSGYARYQGRTAFFETCLTSTQVTGLYTAAVAASSLGPPVRPMVAGQAVSRAANW